MIDLTKIRVLYRQPDTLALIGIPYDLRPGQSPRDIERGREEAIAAYHRASSRGLSGAPWPAPLDWVWLGWPGWWGNIPPEDWPSIKVWLQTLADVPMGPCEWCTVSLKRAA